MGLGFSNNDGENSDGGNSLKEGQLLNFLSGTPPWISAGETWDAAELIVEEVAADDVV